MSAPFNLWQNNPWAPSRNNWPRTGMWYINGEQVNAQDVVRRDPNYVPFQSVLGYGGLQGDPMLDSIYPYAYNMGANPYYNGYGTWDAWYDLRPSDAMAYQYWDANGMGLVNQTDPGSYPWFYNDEFDWTATVDRPMDWLYRVV